MANRLAQGCPASPELLDILYEPFHRWAASHGVGVPVLDTHVASGSFADDVALLGTSLQKLTFLVIGCQCWCALLGIKINLGKTQLWSLLVSSGERVTLQLHSGPMELVVRPF